MHAMLALQLHARVAAHRLCSWPVRPAWSRVTLVHRSAAGTHLAFDFWRHWFRPLGLPHSEEYVGRIRLCAKEMPVGQTRLVRSRNRIPVCVLHSVREPDSLPRLLCWPRTRCLSLRPERRFSACRSAVGIRIWAPAPDRQSYPQPRHAPRGSHHLNAFRIRAHRGPRSRSQTSARTVHDGVRPHLRCRHDLPASRSR